jgi:hypothetical protein
MQEKVPKYIISVHQVVIQAYSVYRTKILDGRQTCMCTMEFPDNGATCNISVTKKPVAIEKSCVHCVVYVFLKRGKKSFYLPVMCYRLTSANP